MNKPTYQLTESSDGYWYEFDSINNNKVIRKAIGFYESIYDSNAVELVFGDLIEGKLDVVVVSDNKDFSYHYQHGYCYGLSFSGTLSRKKYFLYGKY
ncbi:MAG: hypothetical protein R2822_02090 [Spirosomataceae bacterium]